MNDEVEQLKSYHSVLTCPLFLDKYRDLDPEIKGLAPPKPFVAADAAGIDFSQKVLETVVPSNRIGWITGKQSAEEREEANRRLNLPDSDPSHLLVLLV